jgi:hypothetical protein
MRPVLSIFFILIIGTALFGREVEEPEETFIGSVVSRPSKKSLPKAMMYSIILPGAGDLYAGNKGTAKLLLGAETAIWFSYFGFQYYGNIQKDSYMVFAHEKSGSNPSREDEEYYDAVELYRSSDEYNESVREDARIIYPNDPELQNQYVLSHGYFEEDSWQWPESEPFRDYRKMRISTRETFQRATFMTGFAILNRLVAAVTSSRNVRNHNKRVDEMKWGVDIRPDRFSIVYRF